MKNLRHHFAAALLSAPAFTPLCALAADAAASAPAVAPSAVTPAKAEKRPATPQEGRDSATAPGDLRPAARVTPQISVPLMPGGVAGKPAYVRPARGNGAPSGGVDDSAARCNAIADAQARKDCLDKLR